MRALYLGLLILHGICAYGNATTDRPILAAINALGAYPSFMLLVGALT